MYVGQIWSKRIEQWANDRNLIEGSTPCHQLGKLIEEVSELVTAEANKDREEIEDAIGDCAVVLTIIAAMHGLCFDDCLEAAWDQIKDRKGRLVDGQFVKEEDV